ncbi:MAG: elongation factor Ts [Gammaproteobacteria bacterium]|nr:elongation factor Ts [Gammaproteobacteria bacterium]MYJ52600.1 elongation factor Ts [Gammaproteobacteria bacterium]
MTISTAMIKELRERTGAGMMDCKKALQETGGDLELAIEELRKKGAAAAAKRAGRIAAEGAIACLSDDSHSVLVEVNCETDFVAKDDSFRAFCNIVADSILHALPEGNADLGALRISDAVSTPEGFRTIEDARQGLITKIGENISVRRFALMPSGQGVVGQYLHGSRIGVLVNLSGGSDALKLDIAMHIAASRPLCISAQDMDAQVLERERGIYESQAAESGKPPAIVEKMVEGRIRKFLAENTLLGQPFVKNPDITVGELVKSEGVSVLAMERFEVGEGLEKRSDDFVAEVMSQAAG